MELRKKIAELKNRHEDLRLLEQNLIHEGLLPDQVEKQPFALFMETLAAREKKDREYIDPREAIMSSYMQ
ncbi:hypothetical protein [Lactiplantibacillus plantarum]|uniref:hypothetical protein n=1 Tax=Lactiplantibacillus plantarum TaxID=1590 RepID=UPI00070D54CD|nr:hypothetical protein [Lactiplantibacillus plantarum]KRN36108.1 hypothetical protein IV39_GL000501 [Lactiplantibacillus plantarum]MCS8621553.1 hypothetical protein [Lactiplantibacillus plantarum]MCT3251497.1 hypothetical protein [Lactiplantibacillus plantarum]